jgi:phage protein U
MANWVLFQWGPIQFQVFPLNVGEMSHATASDWARKEIAGAAMYREWVGENDEQINLKGRVFPHFFARKSRERQARGLGTEGGRKNPDLGSLAERETTSGKASSGGLGHLDVLDNMRRLGQAHALLRGDGWHFGWFIIDSLQRAHSLIAPDGIGQMIEFEAQFKRVPVPNDPAAHFGYLWGYAVAG